MSLRLDAVRRVVRDEVWIDVTLDLEPGRLYVLLGPTWPARPRSCGSWPASTDRLPAACSPTGPTSRKSVRKRSVAMVYQQFINYPSLTAYGNIASPLRLKGAAAAEVDRRVRGTAKLLHIDHLLDRLPTELSGGQQRLAIARALVKEARLLLLDEPLVNLDYKLREELRAELRDLARQRTTVVYATTEPLEALIMGGDVIVMDEGRVLQTGPTVEVYHRPGLLRVASVFSDPPINTLSVTVTDGFAYGRSGVKAPLAHHLGRLAPGKHTLGVRANHLSIHRHGEGDLAVDATVELAEISGSETFVHVSNGDLHWVVQEEGVHEHALGQPVEVHLDPARLYAFDGTGSLELAPARPSGPG